ncbi:MAG TPA: alpha/beta hydrolase [Acidimicrobiales bacterium]
MSDGSFVAEGRCWRDVAGDGPAVVLVHGTMDRSSSFGRVRRALHGQRVARYDRRGYGRSVELGPPERFQQQVDDLLDVLAWTVGNGHPPVVFGHSYGGTVALAAAAQAPDRLAGVIAYEAPLPWTDWWPAGSAGAAAVAASADPEDAGERFMRRMVGDDRWERLPPSTRAARRAEGPTLVAELAQLRPPNPAPFELASIRVPVLAGHGTDGAPHHAEAARAVVDSVPGADLEVVAGSGHGVHLTHPAAVAAMVRRLVTELAPG